MPKKKETEQRPSAEEQVLEERVDAMMETRADESPAFVGPRESLPQDELLGKERPGPDLPPLDIFADTQGAPDLPKELAKETDIKSESKKFAPAVETPTEPESARAQSETDSEPQHFAALDLDDTANDAAVDDIVAHEQDDPDNLLSDVEEANKAPVHKHRFRRLFWVLITVIAVVAIVTAVLAATGGNLNFPGGKQLQNWFNSISGK